MSGIIGKNASRSSGVIGTSAVGIASLAADSSPQLGGFLDAAGNYIQLEKGGDISSASPTVIDTDGDFFAVTGTTNFSAFTVAADRHFFLEFGAVLTMTHGNGTLDLPGAANITTAASDVGEFVSTAANVVTCVNYTKRDGTAVALADNSITLAKMAGGTDGQIITYDASGDPVAVGPGSDGEVLTSTGAGSPPAFEAAAGGGKVLQVVNETDTGLTSTTTIMPYDNTIPQSGEGIEVMSVAITPADSSNKLIIMVTTNLSHNQAAGENTTALFQDSTAGALAAVTNQKSGDGQVANCTFLHFMAAGTTSATTFKVRVGNNDSGKTTNFNGFSSQARFGGVYSSSITVWEIDQT
jgi:hypothetical protein